MTEDGPIVFYDDARQTADSIRSIAPNDADNFAAFEDRLFRVAEFLAPMMLREPPALGSKKPRDLLSLAREAARAAGLSRSEVHELVRMFTMSVADLLDDYFEHDALKGSIASTGVVGVWAGPNTPGHRLQPAPPRARRTERDRGRLGPRDRRHGRDQRGDRRLRPRRRRRDPHRCRGHLDRRPGRTRRSASPWPSGEQLRAPIVASGAHPKTTVLDLAGAENFPTEVAEDMRRYRTRGGSVKINMVLSEPPRYEGVSDEMQETLRHTGVNLCPSIEYLERAWQDALGGRPAAEPYVECELPSAIDSSLTDDGTWVMTMFTQYGPHDEKGWPEGARERYADACIQHLARYAPNVPDAILEREVLAPPDIERIFGLVGGSIFQGEQGLDQMAFMRPSPLLSGYATPVHGLYLCGAGTHPGGGVMGAPGHNAAKRILRDGRFSKFRRRRAAAGS